MPADLSRNKDVLEVSRTDRHEILQMVGNTSAYRHDVEGYDTFTFQPNEKTAGASRQFQGGQRRRSLGRGYGRRVGFTVSLRGSPSSNRLGRRQTTSDLPRTYFDLHENARRRDRVGALWIGPWPLADVAGSCLSSVGSYSLERDR